MLSVLGRRFYGSCWQLARPRQIVEAADYQIPRDLVRIVPKPFSVS